MLLSLSVSAQKEVAEADKLYDGYEYLKARDIYLKVANRGYKSAYLYKKLGDSYFKTAEYGEAEKWYKKLFDLNENVEPEYLFRYAQTLKAGGKREEGDQYLQTYYSLVKDRFRYNQMRKKSNILYDNEIPLEYSTYKIDSLNIDTKFSDFAPTIVDDNLVFASAGYHPVGYKGEWHNGQPYFDLYIAKIDSLGNLGEPEPLNGDINTAYHESSATFTADRNTMYFSRNNFFKGRLLNTDDKKNNKLQIFRAEKINGEWKTIERLPFNSEDYTFTHPSLSPDGKRLYFSSDMPGSFGSSDIWYVEIYEDNTYSYPQNLGPKVNTTERENFPFVSDDGNLYFASDGQLGYGGLDIFVAKIDKDGMIGDILNLGKPINTTQDDFSFAFDTKKKQGYFSSSRNLGAQRDNLYSFKKSDEIKEGDEKYPLAKKLDSINRLTSEPDRVDVADTIKVGIPKEENIVTGEDLGKLLQLNPIYFEFDRYDIGPRAAIELEKVITVLNKYPNLKLDIRSHTDSRGPDSYNMRLSDNRAKSTIAYIVDSGIEASRITGRGYGESQLVNGCDDEVPCSEDEHQLNRRSEFIIIGTPGGE